MARPSKYDAAIAAKICEALANGNTRLAACSYAGISEDTFARWLKRYADFADSVARAEAEAETLYAGALRKAAEGWDVRIIRRTTKTRFVKTKERRPDGTIVESERPVEDVYEEVEERTDFDWRAAVEWLKRRRKPDWSDTQKVEVTGEDGGPIEFADATERVRSKLATLAARIAAGKVPAEPDATGSGGS